MKLLACSIAFAGSMIACGASTSATDESQGKFLSGVFAILALVIGIVGVDHSVR